MIFMAYLHILLSIDYRGLQGFLLGLNKLVSFDVPFSVPHYSVICRRVNKLDLQIRDTLIPYRGEDVVISLDSTGVKVSNRGEWMRQKWNVRRGWIKVHISVDNKGKQVVGIVATQEDTHDTEEFGNLVDQSIKNIDYAGGRIAQANGDGAYDSNDNFKKLEEHGILPTIKIRKGNKCLLSEARTQGRSMPGNSMNWAIKIGEISTDMAKDGTVKYHIQL